jgi:hypothetical protein
MPAAIGRVKCKARLNIGIDGMWNDDRPTGRLTTALMAWSGRSETLQRSRYSSLAVTSFHSSASGSGAIVLVIDGHFEVRSTLILMNCC